MLQHKHFLSLSLGLRRDSSLVRGSLGRCRASTINDHLHIQLRFQHHLFSGDWVHKFQPFCAEHLVGQSQFPGKGLRFFAAVLGVSQNGKAPVGAVDPQLVGSPGDRPKDKFT